MHDVSRSSVHETLYQINMCEFMNYVYTDILRETVKRESMNSVSSRGKWMYDKTVGKSS